MSATVESSVADVLAAMGEGEGERVALSMYQAGQGYGHVSEISLEGCDSPTEMLDMIRRRWGPGKYKLTVYSARSTYVTSRVVHIAPADGYRDDEQRDSNKSAYDARLERIERSLERLSDGPARQDPTDVASMAAQMTTAMVGAISPLLTAVGQMKQSSAGELVKVLSAGVDIGRGNGGASSGGDPYAALFGGLLSELSAARQATAENPAPAPTAAAAVSTPTAPEISPMIPWLEAVRPYLQSLAATIEGGASPAEIADVLTSSMPPYLLDTMLADPWPVDRIVRAHPPLDAHRDHLRRVLDIVMGEEVEPDTPPDAATSSPAEA